MMIHPSQHLSRDAVLIRRGFAAGLERPRPLPTSAIDLGCDAHRVTGARLQRFASDQADGVVLLPSGAGALGRAQRDYDLLISQAKRRSAVAAASSGWEEGHDREACQT